MNKKEKQPDHSSREIQHKEKKSQELVTTHAVLGWLDCILVQSLSKKSEIF